MWNLPPGAGIASGAGTNSITVNFATNALREISRCTGRTPAATGPVTGLSCDGDRLAAAAGAITGYSNVLPGQHRGGVFGTHDRQCHGLPLDGSHRRSIVSGGNTNSITVNFSMSAISGYVTVYGSNSCGTGATSSYQVTVNRSLRHR